MMSFHEHDHLTGEKPGNHRNQTILAVAFFMVWIIDSFLLQFTTFLFNMTVVWLCVPIGGVIFLLSFYFMNASHHDIFDSKAEGVVTGGVYGRVRHPMYLGTHLVYLGLGVITLSLASILVWAITAAYYNTLAIYEENLLVERFGEEYLEYKKNVRRWIPL
jgi:protein-S-isoprenylcysteine O-methyltransferase Ste14